MRKINAKKALNSRLASGSVTPPVTYALFSKSIKNLPDIAFQIQCQQLEIGVTKSLDECAKWYYEAFYVDPIVRQQYDFRLNASTLKMKEKILSLPPVAAPETNIVPESKSMENDAGIIDDNVTITVDDFGTFEFPVSIATFTKYLNQKKFLANNENFGNKEREKLLTDANACRLYLNEYYNKFYIFPNARPKKLYFEKVTPDVLKELLKPAHAVDERAKATMAKDTTTIQDEAREECIQNIPIATKTKESSSYVSFAVFEKHVKNLYAIVWQLKLNNPDYMCRGFEDCAETFYLAFYQTPEIREKYPIELKNCSNSLRDQIFSIPSKEEASELDKQFERGQLVADNTQESQLNKIPQKNLQNNVCSVYSVEVDLGSPGRFIFPVSIDVFRNFINYDDIIESLLRCNNNKDDTQEARTKIFKRYYNSFYVYPENRHLVQYKFQNASKEMLEILLSIGKPLNEMAEQTMRSKKLATQRPIVDTVYPVSFKQFQKFVKNLNEIAQQMMKCGEFEYLPKSRECYEKEYYKLFYSSPQIRKRFPYELAPCPAMTKTNLLKLPANCSETMIKEQPVVRTINGMVYKYPVSLKTMVKYINYKELIKQLRDAHEKDKSLRGGPSYTDAQLIKKYYNFFYINEEMRRMFKYNFDAASSELKKQLLAFAKPVKANQREREQNNNLNKTSLNDTVVNCGKLGCFKFPVSITTFKKYINYEEISNSLRLQNPQDESELSKIVDQSEDIMSCKNFGHYYLSFYIYPSIRDKHKYKFNCSDQRILEILLSAAKPLNEQAEKTLQAYKCSKEKLISSEGEKLNALPVTFKTFQKYIVNLPEIVNEMKLCDTYKDKTEEECYQEYYKEFYSSMGIRKKFEYKLKPCPLKIKQQLLSFPVLTPTQKVDRHTVDRRENDTILKINTCGSFKYPVSFETFISCINYAEICPAVVKDLSTDKSLLPDPDSPKCRKMFRRYYCTFYVFPKIRKQYPYKFKCPNKELLEKLLSYAQPLDERAKQTIEGAFKCKANEAISVSPTRNVEVEVCAVPVPTEEVSKPVNELRGEAISDTLTRNVEMEVCAVPVPTEEVSKRVNELPGEAISDSLTRNVETEVCAVPVLTEEVSKRVLGEAISDSLTGVSKSVDKLSGEQMGHTRNEEQTRYTKIPTSFNIFKSLLHLDDVVNQMQLNSEHARLSREECAMAYYHAFYYHPSIRNTYKCRIKPCPTDLKVKLLAIPETKTIVDKDHCRTRYTNVAELYAARRAQLKSMKKIIFAVYNPLPPIMRKKASSVTEAVDKPPSEEANKTENSTVAVCNTSLTSTEKIVSPLSSAGTTVTETLSTNDANTLEDSTSSSSGTTPNNARTIETQLNNGQKSNSGASANTTIEDKSMDMEISIDQQVSTTSESSTTDANQHSSAVIHQGNHRTSSLEEEAENIFFSSKSNEHNMRYLLCSSHGIQKTIWRILSQLSLEEFKTYTNIHNGESFYEKESMLSRCYTHVINKGNWPLNLYIKFSMLHELLLSKCVQHLNLQLGELSPKILHWKELMLYTNFDEVVELMYWQRTKETIDNVETLWNERMVLYAKCWRHNRWIQKVPNITDRKIIESFAATATMPLDVECYRNPLCMEEDNIDNEMQHMRCDITESESEQQDYGTSTCPPTQLNLSNFVDVGLEIQQSQQPETQNDPLFQNVETELHSPLLIKQEPIKFLNHLRFTCASNDGSDDFECETMSADDKIIVLDDEEDEAILEKLRCFNHQQDENRSPLLNHLLSSNSLENQITEKPIDVELVAESGETHLNETPPIKARDSVEQSNKVNDGQSLPQQITGNKNAQKRRPIGKTKTTSKRPRLGTDYVPQVTHAFRALPLNAMVRVEVDSAAFMDKETDNTTQQQAQQLVVPQMSASQAFAIDDTLLKSSQLQDLLDPPQVAHCKVNNDVISVNRAGLQPPPVQSSIVVYRQLKSYIFIRSLNKTQAREYGIESWAVGQPYQRALIKVKNGTCYLNGPLLQTLFPRITDTLLVDLKFLLWSVEKYKWDTLDLCMQNNQDLGIRVLSVFMDVAPNFGYFRLKYATDVFNWAACSSISIQDQEFENRQPVFDMIKSIKPHILDEVKQLVNSL